MEFLPISFKILEDACLDLIVRKHVYNCSRIFTAQLITYCTVCGCENMYIVQSIHLRERVQDEKKQERQKCPAGTRQTDCKNWGLVWRNRKKISQINKDYFHLPFFLLIILWVWGRGRGNYICQKWLEVETKIEI